MDEIIKAIFVMLVLYMPLQIFNAMWSYKMSDYLLKERAELLHGNKKRRRK